MTECAVGWPVPSPCWAPAFSGGFCARTEVSALGFANNEQPSTPPWGKGWGVGGATRLARLKHVNTSSNANTSANHAGYAYEAQSHSGALIHDTHGAIAGWELLGGWGVSVRQWEGRRCEHYLVVKEGLPFWCGNGNKGSVMNLAKKHVGKMPPSDKKVKEMTLWMRSFGSRRG